MLGSGGNDEPEQMDVERVNVEMQPSGIGVNDDIPRQDREMQDESHSDNDEMEAESDDEDLPPGNMNVPPRPNFGPPFPNRGLNFGPPFPQQGPPHFGQQQRPPRRPPGQFPGFPPLGGEPIFGGEGHKLGGKEVAVIGDAQLITEEGGQGVN